jgi:hypothetical protein
LQSQLQPNISRKKCSNQCESYYYLHIHPAAGTYENEKPNVGSTQHCMANLTRDTPRLYPMDHEKFSINPIYSVFFAFLAVDLTFGFFTPAGSDPDPESFFFGVLADLRGLAAEGALNCLGSGG